MSENRTKSAFESLRALALGVTYWLLRERDDRLSSDASRRGAD